ncbi:MAG: chromosome segregation protein SMC [Clostridia bacterium]|nr:chromosome segregation protein SMC [Clostridia bacterium]
MSLTKIVIEGFKSFPNRTTITFDKGFTCIVGPNGCGKSNISDAIRWVLGEKSAKQVRGDTMKDLIFSGAAGKKGMSFAEVTLYFDNTDRRFRYSGDEFSITRKIFSSRSENYYYINGQQCKLSEIVELFRDTGAGKGGFSIVGQGKIAEIVNSKDADRRLIFDEAAGIARIKQEKKKTVANLKDVESKMEIKTALADHMYEALKELEEQVEKARLCTSLKEELKAEKLNYFVHIYESSETIKAKIRAQIADYDEYIKARELALDKLRRDNRAYAEENETINVEIDRKHALKERLSVDQANLSGEMKLHESNLNSARDNLAKIKKDVVTTENALNASKDNLKKANDEFASESTKKADLDIELATETAKRDVLESTLTEVEANLAYLNKARLDGTVQIGEFLSNKASAESKVNLLKENLSTATEEYDAQAAKLKGVCDKLAEKEKDIAKISADFTKENEQKRTFGSKKNEATFTRSQTAQALENLRVELATKKIEVENLAIKMRDEKGFARVTNTVLSRAKSDAEFGKKLFGAVGELYTVDSKYEDAISAALGGSVNNIITATAEDAKNVLDYVRQLHQGRLVCQPISEMDPEELGWEYRRYLKDPAVMGLAVDLIEFDETYEPVYSKLLGRIVVVSDYDNALRIWRDSRRGFKIVTLQGDYFDVSGSISGGDNKSDTDVRYKQAKAFFEALSKKFEDTKAAYEKLQKDEAEFDKLYNEHRNAAEDLRIIYAEAEAKLNGLKAEKQEAEEVLNVLIARKATIAEKIALAEKEASEAANSQDTVSKSRLNVDDLIKQETQKKEDTKVSLDESVKRVHQLEIDREKCVERINLLTETITRLNNEISAKEALLEALNEDAKNVDARIEELIANKPEMKRTEEQEAQIKKIDDEIKALSDRRQELAVKRAEADKDIETISDQIRESGEDKAAATTRLENVDSELEEWKAAIMEDYGMSYEDSVPYRREEFEKTKSKAQITKLKAAISRLGDVNYEAERTYTETKKEYDVLSIDLNDLKKGKEDLENLLVRTTNEINEKFSKAFTVINENFSSTFSDLFGGGKAELYLTDIEGADEDERGVDIDVTLPGKSRKPLSLLSGGEQTLTAIAILFAILKYKGSPFVILDEVESALDEVNCIKFAKYLKQFAKISRFIVITHKKPTMNEGDVLYGVTMMEPGVSNVLTVTMAEAEKLANDEEDK